jgi:hypothetical protein
MKGGEMADSDKESYAQREKQRAESGVFAVRM